MPYYNNRFMGGYMQQRTESGRNQYQQNRAESGRSQCQQNRAESDRSQCQQNRAESDSTQGRQNNTSSCENHSQQNSSDSCRPQCSIGSNVQSSRCKDSGEWCQDIFRNAAGPLAMAGVVWQKSESPTYDVDTAFVQGTIFKELDKPFLGRGGCRR